MRRITIQPAIDCARGAVEHEAQTAKCPAVVGDRDEETRRQPIDRADLAADERHPAAEPHRADLEIVHRRHDRCFDVGEPQVRIDVVERAEQLLLGVRVARRAIAADADADSARRAAFALRVPHRVEDAFPDAVERPIRAAQMRQLDGQRVLRVGVLAPAAFQNQLDLHVVAFPLIEMNDRRAGSEVVPGIFARDRIDGIRTQLSTSRRFGNRPANLLAHPHVIGADGCFHLEGRHAGVLTDRAFPVRGEIDIFRDDVQRLRGTCAGRLRAHRGLHGGAHVGR